MRLPQSRFRPPVRSIHCLIVTTSLLLGAVSTCAQAVSSQLTANPRNVRFGTIVLRQTETVGVSLTNTGSTNLTVTAVKTSTPEFSVANLTLPLTLAPQQSIDVNLTFAPTIGGWATGTFAFITNPSTQTLYIGAGGVGLGSESMTPSPASLGFGNVTVGSTATLPVKLTNSGTSYIRLTQVELTGTEFTASGFSFPVILGPGQAFTFDVTFAPQFAGAASGSVILPNAGLTIPLTGTGGNTITGQLTIAPTPLSFGNVTVGSQATQPITMTASGASVTVSSAASSSSQFVLDGASFPFTIAAGGKVAFNVTFAPQNSGTSSGSLSFVSNASSSKSVESLSGVGVSPTYSVGLSWNGMQGVTGYNIYRSTAANGAYARINPAVEPNTTYSDNTVTSGQTYFYAATSVNTSGQESARSAPPAVAVVP